MKIIKGSMILSKTIYVLNYHPAIMRCWIIQVQELMRATGAKLLYLPRYALEFNPIEMLWSVFFFDCLTFLVIDKSFFINWFTKCCCPLITE